MFSRREVENRSRLKFGYVRIGVAHLVIERKKTRIFLIQYKYDLVTVNFREPFV